MLAASSYLTPSEYLPHKRPMVLLDGVDYIDAGKARAWALVDFGYVLRPFLNPDGTLAAYFAVELMAQTIGIWAGERRRLEGRPGISLALLLGVRSFISSCVVFAPGSRLEVEMRLQLLDGRTGSFEGEVCTGGQARCSGRISTYIPGDPAEEARLFDRPSPPRAGAAAAGTGNGAGQS